MTATPPTTLHIKVLSPMLIAGSSSTGDLADIDIHTDPHGFPEIPAGRITSRLRDCAIEVAAGDPGTLDALLVLFGVAGTHHQHRSVLIGAARLPDRVRAAAGQSILGGGTVRGRRIISAITAAYTIHESNTRIGRTGAPLTGTLRSTRMMRPGVSLLAPVTWRSSPDPQTLGVFARVVLSLRQLGGRENDGRGHVSVDFGGGRDQLRDLAGLPLGVTR